MNTGFELLEGAVSEEFGGILASELLRADPEKVKTGGKICSAAETCADPARIVSTGPSCTSPDICQDEEEETDSSGPHCSADPTCKVKQAGSFVPAVPAWSNPPAPLGL